jgi:hypothetical protein
VTRPLTATTVGDEPCVMTTARARLPLCLGMRETCVCVCVCVLLVGGGWAV